MEIKPSSSYRPIPPATARPAPRAVEQGADSGQFAGTDALQRALAATPDIRSEVVQRGQELVSAPAYPPRETLKRLARLFTVEFTSSPSEPAES